MIIHHEVTHYYGSLPHTKNMIKQLGLESFTKMPWKNGGGTTLEMFRILDTKSNDFVLRLSMATVNSNGPFSLFPGVDRTLIILEGDGIKLHFLDRTQIISEKLSPIHFRGEEKINSELINSAVLDFNVMIDRKWGKSHTSILKLNGRYISEDSFTFIFNFSKKILYVLELNDEIELNSDQDSILVRVQPY